MFGVYDLFLKGWLIIQKGSGKKCICEGENIHVEIKASSIL